MVIYVELIVVDDLIVFKDEKFVVVRLQICIFKEGELFFLQKRIVLYNGFRMRKFKGMNS